MTNQFNGDFTKEAFTLLHSGQRFSHIIMNPPYFKLQRSSEVSDYLLSRGVNVTNIYAAFVWLGLLLLEEGGQLVAIVPRSFCNGPYFLKFREYVAQNASVEAIHTFNSRDKVFSKDQVLQENVIVRFAKKPQSETVAITYSGDQSFSDVKEAVFQSCEVIGSLDLGFTISIPSYLATTKLTDYARLSLAEVGLEVSTGPVVDFRLKDSIANTGGDNSVPLLYPAHMNDGHIAWPLDDLAKKGQYYYPQPNLLNGIEAAYNSDKNVSPADGCYVVIRRFSSKEEKRRIYAAVVDSSCYPRGVAFENHLNYFHIKKHGFGKELAYGLSAYLNSSLLDEHFRTFSGHTQVNATDLKNLPYPSEMQLRRIGRIVLSKPAPIETVVTEAVLKACA
jgi:adenine-specific DNA-methyltransferase